MPQADPNAKDAPFDRSLFVLGGARSGKSRHAQAVAEAVAGRDGGRLIYIATAQAFDAEMADRIARHRADRDARWTTVEAPVELARAIVAAAEPSGAPDAVILVDCLTLWASNLLLGDHDIDRLLAALLDAIATADATLIIVANETGLGIVPDNELARRFRDLAGRINQQVARVTGAVDFVLAGIPRRWL